MKLLITRECEGTSENKITYRSCDDNNDNNNNNITNNRVEGWVRRPVAEGGALCNRDRVEKKAWIVPFFTRS